MTFSRTHSQEMSGPEVEIFLQACQVRTAVIFGSSPGDNLPHTHTRVEMFGLGLEGMGGSQCISTLVVQNIASTLCLNVATGLTTAVSTSPLFEGTGDQTRTSHFLSSAELHP